LALPPAEVISFGDSDAHYGATYAKIEYDITDALERAREFLGQIFLDPTIGVCESGRTES